MLLSAMLVRYTSVFRTESRELLKINMEHSGLNAVGLHVF